MQTALKPIFAVIIILTILINVFSFIMTIMLISKSGQFTSFISDIKTNFSLSPLFEIFVSESDCKNSSNEYLFGQFEGTGSGCDCR